MVCVDNPFTTRITRRYYCRFCYEVLADRAAAHVPGLKDSATEAQTVHRVKVLLGIDPGRVEVSETPVTDLSLDIQVAWPAELVDARNPFARFYPQGRALEDHIVAARKWMGQDD